MKPKSRQPDLMPSPSWRSLRWSATVARNLCACGLTGLLLGSATWTGTAVAAECPNEAYRTGFSAELPDCRALEMVTPPRKNGEPEEVTSVAPDGSRISFSSLGAFNEPANASTTEGAEYVDIRGADGWTATPVNPPADEFYGGSPDQAGDSRETSDYSPDLSQTLFLQAPLADKPIDARAFIRSVASGAFTEIGPLNPPEDVAAWSEQEAVLARETSEEIRYEGASADFSHVLFSQTDRSAFNWLWPGDTTMRSYSESLYEYDGTGNSEPELVGVKNETSLASAQASRRVPHLNEAAELISTCGTSLGGRNLSEGTTSRYNAIAADGNTIIFTSHASTCAEGHGPPVDEVYARVNREKTVDISEPGPQDCARCDLDEVSSLPWNGREFTGTPGEEGHFREEAEHLEAYFQGASEDGSRVFFVSAQKLFDGAHGEAGANLYEYDFGAPAGEKVSLVGSSLPESQLESEFEGGGVVRVAEQGGFVYFVSKAVLAGNADSRGKAAQQGQFNLYVYDTANRTSTFIAALAEQDARDWVGTDYRPAEATPDGGFLVFSSSNDLTPDASGPLRQLYRYEVPDAAHPDGTLVRVSVGDDGYNDDGNSATGVPARFAPSYEYTQPQFTLGGAKSNPTDVSADGSKVFFQSDIALTPGALDYVCVYEVAGECQADAENVYEWEEGHVYLISDGRDTGTLFKESATQLVGATPSGSDVFFRTADPLLPQDGDTQSDIYDARVDGGFPAAESPPSCSGEGCQGPPSLPSALEMPGSATFEGQGNVLPATAKPLTASKPVTRAQRLTKALKACRKQRTKAKRKACERAARARYGVKTTTNSKLRKEGK